MNHLFKYAVIGLRCMGATFYTENAPVSLDQLPISESVHTRLSLWSVLNQMTAD